MFVRKIHKALPIIEGEVMLAGAQVVADAPLL